MLKKLSLFFHRYSNIWLLLLSTLLFMSFMIFFLPQQAEKSKAYAEGTGSVDMSFFLKTEAVFEMAEAYGEAGRQQYINARLTFDSIYPLSYGFFLIVASGYFLAKAFNENQFAYSLNLIPFFGVIFDFLENFSVVMVMAAYPEKRTFFAFLVTLFTPMKWVFVNGGFVVILIGLVGWGIKAIRSRGAS